MLDGTARARICYPWVCAMQTVSRVFVAGRLPQIRLAALASGEVQWPVFALCLALFAGAVAVNGFPFLITDTLRYGGALPGLPDAPVLLNFVMQAPFALAGFWGSAAAGMLAAAYAAARLATHPALRNGWLLFPLLALVSLQYLYAGMIGTEIWCFIALALIAAQTEGRKIWLLDIALIGIGALSHNSLMAVSLGAIGLTLALFPRHWPKLAAALAGVLVAMVAEKAIFALTLPGETPMKYTYISGEILSNHPHIREGFCAEQPEALFCVSPYAEYIEARRAAPENQDKIDRKFPLMASQPFVWGPNSFWTHDSLLPVEDRMTQAENEAAGKALWDYALRNHFGSFLAVMPTKIQRFWQFMPPGIFARFDTWYADERKHRHAEAWEPALAGYHDSLQAQGLFLNWRYQRASQILVRTMAVVGLLTPLVLLFAARSEVWRLSVLFAGFFVGNLAAVSIAGAIVGRYVERAYPFLGLNCVLLALVLVEIVRRWRARQA